MIKNRQPLASLVLLGSTLVCCGRVNPGNSSLVRADEPSQPVPIVISNPSPALLEALDAMGAESVSLAELPSPGLDFSAVERPLELQNLSLVELEQIGLEQQQLSLVGEFYRLELRSLDAFGEPQSKAVYVATRFDATDDSFAKAEDLEKIINMKSSKDPTVSFLIGTNNLIRTDRLNEIMGERLLNLDRGAYSGSDDEVKDLLEQIELDRGLGIGFYLKIKF